MSRSTGAGCCTCPASPSGASDGEAIRARLVHLYVCQGLSTYRIGAIVGWDRQRVTRALHAADVTVQARGAARARPLRAVDDPDDLRTQLEKLYLRDRLTSRQIAARLGIPERRVRDRLHRYGLGMRSRGGYDRGDRRSVDAVLLDEIYRKEGLSAEETGRLLHVSRHVVLRSAHDLGLPVRSGGPPRADAEYDEIELIKALYADPYLTAARARHKIPEVPPGGSITERFPRPIPLNTDLLHDLYVGCGLAVTHIELLTGNPAQTVCRLLRAHGIPLRAPGGRSPFLQRWYRHNGHR